MTDGFDNQSSYRTILPIENIVAGQINRIMEYRSKKLWEYYMESVDALIDLLPPDVEAAILKYKQENNISYNNSTEGHERYHQLFREIKKELNTCNIVWHKSNYHRGHD